MVKDSSFTIISYIYYNRKEGSYMDTKRWKVMLAADDYGSFTRVGEELGYTQSGITQMMKALEKRSWLLSIYKG